VLCLRRLGVALAVIAFLLCLPSAWSGVYLDDHFHRAVITGASGIPGLPTTLDRLFGFVSGAAESNRAAIQQGHLPWWTSESLRISFFRPLAALTHWLDYALWPDRPVLMHLQSLLWLALVVVAASTLYGRVLGAQPTALPAFTAGLAAVGFALDDAHGIPAGWLANRYALVCLFFGLLTLLGHDRWRRSGSRAAAAFSAFSFGLALLSGELAVSTAAYLLSYAVFLEQGRWPERLRSLVPYFLIGLSWILLYKMGGYGARGSSAYVDPIADPLRFASVVVERAPVLLAAQWWFPPSDFYNFLSPPAARIVWWIALFLVSLVALGVLGGLAREPAARFFGLGMVLSVLPVSAMYPSDRLLAFVGLGGMGLLAVLLAAVMTGAHRSFGLRAMAPALALVHFLISPLMLCVLSASLWRVEDEESRVIASLPTDPSLSHQYLLFVNAPDPYKTALPLIAHALHGRPFPARTIMLGEGIHPISVERTDDRTLVMRPAAGYLPPSGFGPSGALGPTYNQKYASQLTSRLFRSNEDPFVVGQRIHLDGVVVEVSEVTRDARPAAATFRFDKPLEDASYRWLRWDEDHFVPFTPPSVHQTVTVD
jgi:hypothetical protein